MSLTRPTEQAPAAGRAPTRLDRLADRVGRFVSHPRGRSFVLALPGLIAIATGVVLSLFDGGYDLSSWYSAGLFLLALLALVSTLQRPRDFGLSRFAWGALLAYAAFIAINYLSILWAAVPADAWDGANRALVFGLAFAIVLTAPWSRDVGIAALALVGFGILAVSAGTLLDGALGDPLSQFVGGRLSAPAGYANAAAALFLMGVFPLLFLAAARVLPWALRGVSLGGATVLLHAALLTQSRGGALAVAAAAAIFLLVVPQRWAALACMAVVGGLTALQFETLTDLTGIASAARFEAQLVEAREAIAVSALVATLAGALGALAGQRAASFLDAGRRAGNWALAIAAVAAVAVALAAIGNPAAWAERRWDDFRSSGYSSVESGDTRFGGSLGSNRYDFYRVALDEFGDNPVFGIGSENFLVPYLEQRRSTEAPHFPHSLPLRLLAQLGAVGTAAFVSFLSLILIAVARRVRRAGQVESGIAAAGLAVFGVWFAQGTVDWLWAFTGLGLVAFAMLALAARSGSQPQPNRAGEPANRRSGGRGAVAVAVTFALGVSLALPGIAERYVASGYDRYAEGAVGAALERLDRAAELDFLSAEPLLAKGVIAQRGDMPGVAAAAFADAIRREPDNWLARLELGMSLARRGDREAAVGQIAAAARLNPRQPAIDRVLRRVERGQPVDPVQVERELESRLTSKLRPLAAPDP